MRQPRMQFTVRRLMVAVVIVGIILALGMRMRPQPVRVQIRGNDNCVTWSDGSETKLRPGGHLPSLNGGERFAGGFLARVKWFDPDGTSKPSTWHLTWPSEPIPSAPQD
jgi:hypothetical protein